MSKIIGATVGTPINPDKVLNTEVQDAVNKYLDEHPIAGMSSIPAVYKLNDVSRYEDILNLYNGARYTYTDFFVLNQGESFNVEVAVTEGQTAITTLEHGDVYRVYFKDGTLNLLEYWGNREDDESNYAISYLDDNGTEHKLVVMSGGGNSGGGATVEDVLAALPTWEGGNY